MMMANNPGIRSRLALDPGCCHSLHHAMVHPLDRHGGRTHAKNHCRSRPGHIPYLIDVEWCRSQHWNALGRCTDGWSMFGCRYGRMVGTDDRVRQWTTVGCERDGTIGLRQRRRFVRSPMVVRWSTSQDTRKERRD
ncbi:hypothetical protein CARUB_v10003956mg [Capsella rubella]|uniref:Uncharacterized protein n=1 Tax=Capsella rubella TaxID=81985 RepID=R0ESV6_9BRAS|nr:hypothetical protein CARUB_v10003956mg [Capsella rubella]